jgi:hypothetical protein
LVGDVGLPIDRCAQLEDARDTDEAPVAEVVDLLASGPGRTVPVKGVPVLVDGVANLLPGDHPEAPLDPGV